MKKILLCLLTITTMSFNQNTKNTNKKNKQVDNEELLMKQANALIKYSAFAYIMEQGSLDMDQKEAWATVRELNGTYATYHLLALLEESEVQPKFQELIVEHIKHLRQKFISNGYSSVSDNVGKALAYARKSPHSLDQLETAKSNKGLLQRLLIEDFAPPTRKEIQEFENQVGELEDIVDEAFRNWINK